MSPSSATRGFAASRFALTLDGTPVGLVKSISGGGAYADVIAESAGGAFAEKHVGPPKYEDIEVELGIGVDKTVQTWIEELLAGKASRRSGTIETADAAGNVKSVLEFENALITQIGFPALDGSSKDTGSLTLTFRPESTRKTKGSGTLKSLAAAKQKKWLLSKFRFELGDLPTARVSKIEAFAIKQQVAADSIAEIREHRKRAGILEIPNLKVTFSEADLAAWEEWFDDFVLKGNSGQEQELSGSIAFLDPTLKNKLGSIELSNVGIYRLAPEPQAAGAEKIRRWAAELYVESMKFTLGDLS